MNHLDVKKNIIEGMKNGYFQNIQLLSTYEHFINQVQEYLLTVNVAQMLLEWNANHEYKIHLEYPINYFYKNAFQAYDWIGKDIFDMELVQRDKDHAPTGKLHQKIDLAITQERMGSIATNNHRTISGIELKGINKKKDEVIKDAERLSEAMMRMDDNFSNSIDFCFCGFIRRLDKEDKIVNKSNIKKLLKDEENRWIDECDALGQKYPKIDFSIEQFDILNTSLEDVTNYYKSIDSDYSEVASNTGIVAGYILTIQRKSTCN